MNIHTRTLILIGTALGWLAILFGAYFFLGRGYYSLTVDGQRYLAATQGLAVDLPYNSRLLVPLLAAALVQASGIAPLAALQTITAVSLFGALALLVRLLVWRGAPAGFVAACLVGWGSGQAIFYGARPTLVDTSLLLASCVCCAALAQRRLAVALCVVCVAALIKEYGILLVIPWAWSAYCRGTKRALWGFVPVGLLGVVFAVWPKSPGVYSSYEFFAGRQLLYQAIWLHPEAMRLALTLWYLSAWGAAWPLLISTLAAIVERRREATSLSMDDRSYLAALCALPVLLIADWDRTFVILVPFAMMAGANAPFARRRAFQLALAVGGPATAIWREIEFSRYLGPQPLDPLRPLLIGISVSATLVVLFLLLRMAQQRPA